MVSIEAISLHRNVVEVVGLMATSVFLLIDYSLWIDTIDPIPASIVDHLSMIVCERRAGRFELRICNVSERAVGLT